MFYWAGPEAADVLAVRRLVLAYWLMKTAVVGQSVASSSQTEDFQRSLKVLVCCIPKKLESPDVLAFL